MGKGIKSYSEIERNIKSMNKTLLSLSDSLKKLKTLLTRMMTEGEGGDKLWTGANAETFFAKSVKNLNNNIVDYHTAYKKLKVFNKYYIATKNAANDSYKSDDDDYDYVEEKNPSSGNSNFNDDDVYDYVEEK